MKKRNLPTILSLLLLSILVLITLVNFLYINNVGNSLTELALAISGHEDAMRLQHYWESQTSTVSISVSNSAIEKLSDAIDTLVCYAESGRDEEVARSIALVLNAIDGIRRLERISINNIL